MNSLPRLVGRQLPEAQGGGVNHSLLSSANPNGSNRELSIITPSNIVLGTTEAQLSLQQNTQTASLVAQDNAGNVAASVSSMIEYDTGDQTPVPRVEIKADGIRIGNISSSAGITTSAVAIRALKGITVDGNSVIITGHDSIDNGVKIKAEGKGIQIMYTKGTFAAYIIINQTGIHISGNTNISTGDFTIDTGNLEVSSGNITVGGNLTVNGSMPSLPVAKLEPGVDYSGGIPPVGGLLIARLQEKQNSSASWTEKGSRGTFTLASSDSSTNYPLYRAIPLSVDANISPMYGGYTFVGLSAAGSSQYGLWKRIS